MNKVLKGLVAVAATAAMAVAGFAGAASATAAENNYDITVPSTDSHTYSVYQVFTGDPSNGTLSNIEAGQNFNTNNTKGKSAAEAAADIAQNTSADTDNTARLAAITPYVDLTGPAFGEVSAANKLSAPAGYYLLKDKDAVTGDDAATLFIVQVNGPVTVNRKADKPSFEKKVKDVNDSTGVTTDWQDSADYDMNDDVPFQLTATLPSDADNFAAYKTYKLVFHDNQSAGLTFKPETVVVKYEGTTLNTESYTLDQAPTDGHTFDITITNAKSVNDADGAPITVAKGGKFTVEYKSTLNENAVIGAAGNPNEASLEFSNNPNVGGEGNTGKTPTDKVIVFTYQLDIDKTFNGGTPDDSDLPEFTLYKFDSTRNDYTTNLGKVKITKTTDGKYTASFKRVDDGKYKLVETKTPAGFNTAADTTFEITADHDVTSDDPTLTSLKINSTDGNTTTGTVVADVVNQKGSNLPSTGGMGTVLLYVAGIAVFVLAGATLVMALRRRNA
ncbi:isopeptide-forming domain-containing fimbrial protein [Bifidobacterium ruminantium]|uniref:isopeptide-forming domain-containing fimbrial protein n=1 Tax=Bifidobacterium ruminantium TaxID=78346 RepID=UPI00195CAA89|nr:isopeptide-forming domain-containing fimbrial protein [Bifidobacterium ruminantium]MBM6747321.1 isopeptide-forming domain-containing fimbrial protein [Bifidobacterium ruminantium]